MARPVMAINFAEGFFAHSFGASRGAVGGDAVGAVVGDADGDVDHLAHQRVNGCGL